MKKWWLIIFFSISLSFYITGCTYWVTNSVTDAREAFSNGNFKESIDDYTTALKDWNDKETYPFKKSGIEKELNKVKDSSDSKIIKIAKDELNSNQLNDAETTISSSIFYNTNRKDLIELKANIKIAKIKLENRLEAALNKMRTRYDDVQNITWYYDETTPSYADVNNVYLYMGKDKDKSVWLRFRIQYAAEDWLFVNSYKFKIDDDTIDYTPSKVDRDNKSSIWEWSDEQFDANIYKIVQKIITSKSCKIRYIGDKYYHDRTITDEEKMALQNVLDAYASLGGSLKDFENK